MRAGRHCHREMPPHFVAKTKDNMMVEILFMAEAMRRPLQAVARRWYCRNLFRASKGRFRCGECTRSLSWRLRC